ncbi:diaminobutyrate acetyltransferase [Thiomicrorhabdus sp. 6S3-12]|uniref:diaminobutyrate acetyltransferase n=1 Tax=Thiomicrorhabdus sp. 6S3-12 TaxID=2819681 RepID=UPI001AAE0837|nr:diaminobutyrate acetyltransferase [Thiomicrorhabdus sp. 6S3-12]MBO1923086.1 diaminobutyrate acetyltransferase [Thiomicrorhabdus sp. 6S3-12]
MEIDTDNSLIKYRRPRLEDGLRIYQLIADSPPLDLNSSYLYFLQSSHFADTCVVAESDGELLGFISGYLRPDKPEELFVWQMVVAKTGRGRGIAKGLVKQLIKQSLAFSQTPLQSLSCTISPSNQASQGVFKSLAKAFGLTLRSETFLTEAHFAGQEHEAEDYYFLTAPDGQSLNDYLTDT